MKRNLLASRRLWAGLAVAGLAAAGIAVAASASVAATDPAAVINGCVSRQGTLRVLTAGDSCTKNETALSWNVQGPAGPPGGSGAGTPVYQLQDEVDGLATVAHTDVVVFSMTDALPAGEYHQLTIFIAAVPAHPVDNPSCDLLAQQPDLTWAAIGNFNSAGGMVQAHPNFTLTVPTDTTGRFRLVCRTEVDSTLQAIMSFEATPLLVTTLH